MAITTSNSTSVKARRVTAETCCDRLFMSRVFEKKAPLAPRARQEPRGIKEIGKRALSLKPKCPYSQRAKSY